jgi:hypothetical protein
MPSRILAVTGIAAGTAARTAPAMRCSSSGSSSSAAPPRLRFTSGVGQPKLRSMPKGLSCARWAALAAIRAGSEPSNWMRTGVPLAVREPVFSSGERRVKQECGSSVVVTRTNSVTHQSYPPAEVSTARNTSSARPSIGARTMRLMAKAPSLVETP